MVAGAVLAIVMIGVDEGVTTQVGSPAGHVGGGVQTVPVHGGGVQDGPVQPGGGVM